MKDRSLEEFGELLDGGLGTRERITVKNTTVRIYDERAERKDFFYTGPVEVRQAGETQDHQYKLSTENVERLFTPEDVTVGDTGDGWVGVELDEEKRLIFRNPEGIYY